MSKLSTVLLWLSFALCLLAATPYLAVPLWVVVLVLIVSRLVERAGA